MSMLLAYKSYIRNNQKRTKPEHNLRNLYRFIEYINKYIINKKAINICYCNI